MCARVCLCVCVLYHVGMCFYAEIQIKSIPPGVEDQLLLFMFILFLYSFKACSIWNLHFFPLTAQFVAAVHRGDTSVI